MDPKRQEVARLDWDRIWPYQANQHFVPQTLNKTAGLAVKMPSPCITLQGSACNSGKWLMASLLWSPWSLNHFTYSTFCKKRAHLSMQTSCTLGYVSDLLITPSLALGKTVLNGKHDGETAVWSLQSYYFMSLKEEFQLKVKMLLQFFRSRRSLGHKQQGLKSGCIHGI